MTTGDRPWADVPVLVLGASGFVGRWVARRLTAGGARVTGAVRDPDRARAVFAAYDIAAAVAAVDLADARAVERLFAATRPAITFNLAGYGVDRSERDEQTFTRINVDLVREIADLVEQHAVSGWPGLRLVHTGSALEYGAIGGHLVEDAEPNPTTTYGQTKLAATRCLAGHAAAVTARLFTVYGPGEHDGRLLPSLLEATRSEAPVKLSDGRQRRDFTFVEDVADGLLRLGLCRPAAGGTLNLATGTLHSVRDFVRIAARVLRIPEQRFEFGAAAARPEEMAHDAVAVDRIRSALGWVPDTTIEDGVAQTQQFLAMRSHP